MPLALWPTAPGPAPVTATCLFGIDGGGLSTELARRIVEEYSHPGELILDLTCTSATVLIAAAEVGRRAVGITGEDRIAAATFEHCEQQLPAGQAQAVEVITARLSGLPRLRPDLAGAADLAVLPPVDQDYAADDLGGEAPTGRPIDAAEQTLPAVLAAARALLRPGGLLVTVTTGARHGHAFHDTAGQMVRLARAAGFGYTQHVIALRAPIGGDHLTATPSRTELAHLRADHRAGGRRHLLVHQDVSVFVAPAQPETAAHDVEDVTA